MDQLNSDSFDILTPITHYKNLKTEVIDDLSHRHSMDKLDYAKIKCLTKDLLKEKDRKIELLQQHVLQLQKKLDQQKPNINYKSINQNNSNSANNINYTILNFNTSTNFPLKSEIKKTWEELALVSLLDNFIDYENKPEIIFHLVSELVIITDKLISELCLDMYQKVSQSLNIINDNKIINDIEKTSRPLIKEHLNKTFAGTNNQQFIDKVINLFKISAKKIFEEGGEGVEKISKMVSGIDFKIMIKKIKDILLFTKFNDPQLLFRIEKDFSKRLVEKIKIENNYEKNKYLIINDNNKEDIEAVIILKPPILRSGFPLNNDFKTIIILYEKEGNCKSYKNILSINNNKINNNKRKINKILAMQIKRILPCLKNQNNNIKMKTEECSYNRTNKQRINQNKKFLNEEIINTVYSKEQRNSYQKISNNINLNINHKEKKNKIRTDYNNKMNKKQNECKNKENNILNKNYEDKENNISIKNNFDINQKYKIKNKFKSKENFSNDNQLSEKRNNNFNKKNRLQLSNYFLKNNSSKNLFDYMHNYLLKSSSLKKYKNIPKETHYSFNQNLLITFNNCEMKRNISLSNRTDDEVEKENEKDNKILYNNNISKGVFNIPDNSSKNNGDFEEKEINTKNKKQRNSSKNQEISKINQLLYFNPNENNNILNNQGHTIDFNLQKDKFNSENSLNKLDKKNLKKYVQNNNNNNAINDNSKNYKKIINQKRENNIINKNLKNKNKIVNYYKSNKIYECLDINDNEYYRKLKITAVDLYSNNILRSKIENNDNMNIYNQNKNKNNNTINQNNNNINSNNNQCSQDQDLILFKKYKTSNIISNKVKNNYNKNIKKKNIPLIKMKTQKNNINSNNNNNDHKSKSSIKNNHSTNSKNKLIQNNNSIGVDNYKKIIRNNKNKNINNNFTIDNNSLSNFHSKKKINYDINRTTKKGNNYEDNENCPGNNLLISANKYKYNNYLLSKNHNLDRNNSLNEEKKFIKEINFPDIRNNNLIEKNIFEIKDLNNTGYKIKNVNINYFNIMQPKKLYINQNSKRSKSRQNDCERNNILLNLNNFNKNIFQNPNIDENNLNNKKLLLLNRVNNNINKKKNSSQENSNRINQIQNYDKKLNLIKNNTNNNIIKNSLNIITDLTDIEKMTPQLKNKKIIQKKTNVVKQNEKALQLKEEKINNKNLINCNDKIYMYINEDKKYLTISNKNTSRKKNKSHLMNNKHITFLKIPKKSNNNEIRQPSGGVKYIENKFNKFNSEYENQISVNFNINEINEMRGNSLIEKDKNNFQYKNNIIINVQNNIKCNNSNINYQNYNKNINNQNETKLFINKKSNKNSFGYNGMMTYNYNSFRKINKDI